MPQPGLMRTMMMMIVSALVAASVQEPITVTVFYEVLCPDSIAFMRHQLFPTWALLGAENMTPDLVPYGKASQHKGPDDRWKFSCQHGHRECEGNMEHACALHLLGSRGLSFVGCSMSARDPPSAGQQCAAELGLDYGPIQNCTSGSLGGIYLAEMGDRTHNFQPTITFVPTVAFNGVYSYVDQNDALDNLTAVVCRHLEQKPSACG